MFTRADISKKMDQRPFQPLRIVVSSGASYEVKHPELAMVGQREMIVGISNPLEPRSFDRVARVLFLHISAIEDLAVETGGRQPDGNGD